MTADIVQTIANTAIRAVRIQVFMLITASWYSAFNTPRRTAHRSLQAAFTELMWKIARIVVKVQTLRKSIEARITMSIMSTALPTVLLAVIGCNRTH